MEAYEKFIHAILKRLPQREVEEIFDSMLGFGKGAQVVRRVMKDPIKKVFDKAFSNGTAVQIEYKSTKGKETVRLVSPICFVHRKDQWGVFAWCHMRSASRWFNFDRMRSARCGFSISRPSSAEIAMAVAAQSPALRQAILEAVIAADHRT